jgi:hypothetical protein
MSLGVCDGCAGLKRLRDDGTVPIHMIGIPVSRRAITSVGRGRVSRRCPGSLKAPRRVAGQ